MRTAAMRAIVRMRDAELHTSAEVLSAALLDPCKVQAVQGIHACGHCLIGPKLAFAAPYCCHNAAAHDYRPGPRAHPWRVRTHRCPGAVQR